MTYFAKWCWWLKDDDSNKKPTFDNLNDNRIRVKEGQTEVYDIDASDLDGDDITYSIAGGRDSEFFTVDPDTGVLSFKEPPDYENPQSGGTNGNRYKVTVKISDGNGGMCVKDLVIKVKDVEEPDPGQDPSPEPIPLPEPECIILEAEDFRLCGFYSTQGDNASGGKLVRLKKSDGYIKTKFSGETGDYAISLCAQDESDGASKLMVYIDGKLIKMLRLDGNTDGKGSDDGVFSSFDLGTVQVEQGARIKIEAWKNCGEMVRLDKLVFKPVDGDCEPPQQDPECPCPEGTQNFDADKDGNALVAGTVVFDQFNGFTVVAQRDGNNTPANDAMLFDTASPTGGDTDLAYDNKGMVVIISEDNDDSDPDDAASGGTLTFTFTGPSLVSSLEILDIEETGGAVRLYDAGGGLLGTFAIPVTGDNGVSVIDLGDTAGVKRMEVQLAGSGALGELCFCPPDNTAPDPVDVEACLCADELDFKLDLLKGVTTDADGDVLNVTSLTITEIKKTLDDVPVEILTGPELASFLANLGDVFDDANDEFTLVNAGPNYAAPEFLKSLGHGESVEISFEYNLSDGSLSALSTGSVLIKGVIDDVAEFSAKLAADLPAMEAIYKIKNGRLEIADDPDYLDVRISGTGVEYLDTDFAQAYCVDWNKDIAGGVTFDDSVMVNGKIHVLNELTPPALFSDTQIGKNGETAFENMDIMSWIINQDFVELGTYTEFEVQAVIWALTDGAGIRRKNLPDVLLSDEDMFDVIFNQALDNSNTAAIGERTDAKELYDLAIVEGEDYVTGAGDKFGMVLDPMNNGANGQPLLIFTEFECVC